MHYNPVVDASKESDDQEIANPDYKNIKKEVKQLKNELAKCGAELGRIPVTTKKDGSVRKSKKRDRLEQKRVEVKEKLAATEQKAKSCPERVKLDELKPGKKFKVLDTEGKNLWNLAETLVWNSRKELVEMFGKFLQNPRDLIPVLDATTKSRGWVRSTKEAVEVRLDPLDTPRFKAAQIQLCRTFNEKNIRLKNGKRLLYDVGENPIQKMSKN
jgi:hypothetical protein